MALIVSFFKSIFKRKQKHGTTHRSKNMSSAAAATAATAATPATAVTNSDSEDEKNRDYSEGELYKADEEPQRKDGKPANYRLRKSADEYAINEFFHVFGIPEELLPGRLCADIVKRKVGTILEVGSVRNKEGERVTLKQTSRKHYGLKQDSCMLPKRYDFVRHEHTKTWYQVARVTVPASNMYNNTKIKCFKVLKLIKKATAKAKDQNDDTAKATNDDTTTQDVILATAIDPAPAPAEPAPAPAEPTAVVAEAAPAPNHRTFYVPSTSF